MTTVGKYCKDILASLEKARSEHLELESLLNQLDNLSKGHAPQRVWLAVVGGFVTKTIDHISTEETLMASIRYCGAQEHNQYHRSVLCALSNILAECEKDGEHDWGGIVEHIRIIFFTHMNEIDNKLFHACHEHLHCPQ